MDAVDGLATELSSPAMVARVPMIRKVLYEVSSPETKVVLCGSPPGCVYHGKKSPMKVTAKPIHPRYIANLSTESFKVIRSSYSFELWVF